MSIPTCCCRLASKTIHCACVQRSAQPVARWRQIPMSCSACSAWPATGLPAPAAPPMAPLKHMQQLAAAQMGQPQQGTLPQMEPQQQCRCACSAALTWLAVWQWTPAAIAIAAHQMLVMAQIFAFFCTSQLKHRFLTNASHKQQGALLLESISAAAHSAHAAACLQDVHSVPLPDSEWALATRLMHPRAPPADPYHATVAPLYQTATFQQVSLLGAHRGACSCLNHRMPLARLHLG